MPDSVELLIDAKVTLGEGPFWDADAGVLYWLDILSGQVFIYDPATGRNKSVDVGEHVGTIVPRKDGGAIVALQCGVATLDLDTGTFDVKCDPEKDLPQNRFNDGKCDPAGRFWAGTLSYSVDEGAGSLYCVDTDFSVKRMVENVTVSNGVVWSLDEKVMYYIDSPTRCVDAFDYDKLLGEITNRRTVIRFDKRLGFPDGMTIDEEGMLWIAQWGSASVGRWDPAGGKMLAKIDVPAKEVTACALGGENLDELYITTAREHISEEELKDYPLSGGLFRVKVDVKGVPLPKFGP